jgi:hypothetical protein
MVSDDAEAVLNENKTSLQEKHIGFQSIDDPTTRKDLLSSGLIFFAIGIVMLIVGLILAAIGYRAEGPAAILLIIGVIMAFMSFFAAIFGAWRLISSLFVRSKVIKCPYCQYENRILRKIAWIFCQGCRQFLVLSKNDNSHPNMVDIECPYCNRIYASSDCVTSIVCDDCNLSFDLQKGKSVEYKGNQVACEKCGKSVPESIFFCRNCGAVINDDFVSSFETVSDAKQWERRVKRSPKGNFRYGSAILDKIKEVINRVKLQDNSLEESINLLKAIEAAIESYEIAALDNKLHSNIVKKLIDIDYIYAVVLTKIAREIERTEVAVVPKEDAEFLSKYVWIDVREKVLSKLQMIGKTETSVFYRWQKNVFSTEKIQQEVDPLRVVAKPDYTVVKDVNLLAEAKLVNIDGYHRGMKIIE